MCCSTSFALLVSLITIALGLVVQPCLGDEPLFHFCSNTGSGSGSGSSYGEKLGKLVGSLSIQAPPSGFAKASVGQSPNQLHGLALCRGDVSIQDCKACITDAGNDLIKHLCPSSKGAIVWYDYCLLKYSDQDFFGHIDDQNKFYMWNLKNVTNPAYFNHETKQLLTQLTQQAYATPKLYASGDMQLSDSQKLYGLTQCTRDISSADCRKCLDGIIAQLPNCCDGKQGGRVVGGSCNFRYEIYPFLYLKT